MEITHEKLSASLGSLLLLWARIEEALRAEVISVHEELPRRAHGIASLLLTWKQSVVEVRANTPFASELAATLHDQLLAALRTRNGLCHGFKGVLLSPDRTTGHYHWPLNDADCSIGWEELNEQLSWLSRQPYAISIISTASFEEPGNRLTDTAENREWWRSEFQIALCD